MTNTPQHQGLIKLAGAGVLFLSIAIASSATAEEQQSGLLRAASAVLGVQDIKSLQFAGTGSWYQFGQAAHPQAAWPRFELSSYAATVDYEIPAARVQQTRKQALEAGRERPAPVEQKADQFVNAGWAWNLTTPAGKAPTAQAQPAAVEERIADVWTTPQGFIRAALANNAQVKAVKAGAEVSFTLGKSRYVGALNNGHQVVSVKTWIDNPVLGDTPVEYRYSDYKSFGAVQFPAHIVKVQGGHPVLDLQVASVSSNVSADLAVPDEVRSAKLPPVVVTVENLAPGVFYLRGGSHHSVAIEQRDHIVVVEAPQNEERSEAVIAKLKEIIPGKPIRYVINTHQHFDHSGGLRTYAAEGVTVVTHKLNKPFYEQAWAAPHGISPDRLATSGKSPKFQTFGEKYVLNDGSRKIEIHQIAGNGHNDAFALVYLPAEKVLVEADAFTPAADGAVPAVPNPYSVNLYQNIQRLKLNVDKIAALHGPGVTRLADLQAAIGLKVAANP